MRRMAQFLFSAFTNLPWQIYPRCNMKRATAIMLNPTKRRIPQPCYVKTCRPEKHGTRERTPSRYGMQAEKSEAGRKEHRLSSLW